MLTSNPSLHPLHQESHRIGQRRPRRAHQNSTAISSSSSSSSSTDQEAQRSRRSLHSSTSTNQASRRSHRPLTPSSSSSSSSSFNQEGPVTRSSQRLPLSDVSSNDQAIRGRRRRPVKDTDRMKRGKKRSSSPIASVSSSTPSSESSSAPITPITSRKKARSSPTTPSRPLSIPGPSTSPMTRRYRHRPHSSISHQQPSSVSSSTPLFPSPSSSPTRPSSHPRSSFPSSPSSSSSSPSSPPSPLLLPCSLDVAAERECTEDAHDASPRTIQAMARRAMRLGRKAAADTDPQGSRFGENLLTPSIITTATTSSSPSPSSFLPPPPLVENIVSLEEVKAKQAELGIEEGEESDQETVLEFWDAIRSPSPSPSPRTRAIFASGDEAEAERALMTTDQLCNRWLKSLSRLPSSHLVQTALAVVGSGDENELGKGLGMDGDTGLCYDGQTPSPNLRDGGILRSTRSSSSSFSSPSSSSFSREASIDPSSLPCLLPTGDPSPSCLSGLLLGLDVLGTRGIMEEGEMGTRMDLTWPIPSTSPLLLPLPDSNMSLGSEKLMMEGPDKEEEEEEGKKGEEEDWGQWVRWEECAASI
ncbi:MAG: hypothetical protein DHS80DRAFT_28688 [Piptocephalis tieghemiana]|nr:MAG: hypothetical protein DHS80DRAFT_28688 [Piptocephalis tieghemiana]